MYRDNTLIPTEAIRLAALGYLASAPAPYADVAAEVRQFTGRIVGPSLEVLGTSIELLRYEGLVEPVDDTDDSPLQITEAGRLELISLLRSNVRTPVDGVNKLILALKMRYLHMLDPAAQGEQIDMLLDMSRTELVRLDDLADRYRNEPGHFRAWLVHDQGQVQARIDWLEGLRGTS